MDMWKIFDCGKIFGGGIDFFFFVGIFRHVILVMKIFLDMWFWSWNNGLNFYVVEPQELG